MVILTNFDLESILYDKWSEQSMTNLDVSTIEQLHLNFIHYQNLSLLSTLNLTNDIISINTNQLNWPVLTLSILAIFGTLGNLLVCASISLDKQLQTVTNWFLFSLAIADCLVSLVVLPLSIIKDFQGK
jgi:5-hydroxytryptamine receptor 2